jgi:ribonuclease P/MRP protein subunit POP5
MKGKPLLPTLRTKKRYVAYDVICDGSIDTRKAYGCIRAAYKECFGDVGLSLSGMMDTKIHNGNKGILKINHKYLDEMRLAMAGVKKIEEKDVILHTVGVSGMLAKTKKSIGG